MLILRSLYKDSVKKERAFRMMKSVLEVPSDMDGGEFGVNHR